MGDQIVAVNDTRVAGLRTAASDVYKLLRTCGGTQSTLRLEIIPANTSDFIHAECKSEYIIIMNETVREVNEKREFYVFTVNF